MALNGIDISNHNHPLDPTAVPGSFVIMRASEGKGMRDPHFAGYDAKVRPSSRLPGAYHFCWVGREGRVINTPESEAANFASAVTDHLRPGFLLVADWEPAGALARETGWAVAFAREVKRLTGRAPLLYANRSTLDHGLWQKWRAAFGGAYWLAGGTAQYAQRVDGYTPGLRGRNPYGFGDPVMWQFTEHGYLPGWGKRLDLNVFYGDPDRWRALADGTRTPVLDPTPTPPKKGPVTIKTLRGFRFGGPDYWSHLAREEYARLRGWCKVSLDIYQAIGRSSLSAGTHLPHGATDYWLSHDRHGLSRFARNGGTGGFIRGYGDSFSKHMHDPVNLPCLGASYQIAAVNAGYNGLGRGGRGGRDTSPRDGVRWPLRSWADGLAWMRAEIDRLTQERDPISEIQAYEAQELHDFWNPWLAVDAWDAANPEDSTLTGLSDEDLRERFIAHGFTFYNQGSLHEDMRFTLADFAGSLALADIERDPDQVAWDLLNRVVADPDPGITWVELRPVFDAGRAGGDLRVWGADRTRHSVRAVQEGLTQLGWATVVDGLYGPQTRAAVAAFQVQARGARTDTAASGGVVGVNDFLHLTAACSQRVGREHRARFLY